MVRRGTLQSASFAGLAEVLRAFLQPRERVSRACLGIAGPVVANRCEATNLPWVADGARVAKELGMGEVTLINDLVALGFGALTAPRSKLTALTKAHPPKQGTLAILAAGTGLGEAALVWDGQKHVPLASEGGHTDFAARNPLEEELLHFLQKRHGRVSYERVLSGPGLGALYDFFAERPKTVPPLRERTLVARAAQRNETIVQLALSKKSRTAVAAIETFVRVYGAEAGNLALKVCAAGVYVCGGIAEAILPWLTSGDFLKAYCSKGRLSNFVSKIPVSVVRDKQVGLKGAAYFLTRDLKK